MGHRIEGVGGSGSAGRDGWKSTRLPTLKKVKLQLSTLKIQGNSSKHLTPKTHLGKGAFGAWLLKFL